jgi:hypothetical protein
VLAEAAEFLIRRFAAGETFRLIGVGVDDLRPATQADPPGLFDVA